MSLSWAHTYTRDNKHTENERNSRKDNTIQMGFKLLNLGHKIISLRFMLIVI